jgi:DNA polymerase-3 subunit alpha
MACGFHAHSDMSLDGGVTIEQKINRAIELGRPADCLTDHGNMNGLALHHMCCSKKKILAIMGIEAYVIDPYEPTKVVMRRGKETTIPNFAHMTIHFKTQEAYQYFCKLTPIMESRAVTIFGERKPLMIWEELEGIAGQIVIGSGCLVSFIQKHVLNGRIDRATHMYEKIRSLAGPENFYVEVFGHEVTHNWKSPGKDTAGDWLPKMFVPNECDAAGMIKDIQKDPNDFVIMMARKYGDKILCSEDSHLSTEDNKQIQDCKLSNGESAWKFYNAYSMESTDFWAEKIQHRHGLSDKNIEEMVDNSYHFIEHFKDYKFHTAKDGWFLPSVKTIFGDKYEGKSNKEILKELIRKSDRMPPRDHPRYQEYLERLKYEVSVIADNGKIDLLPYFFTVADIADWCRDNDVLMNLRGSGGGCLLAYLLGLSVTDSVKWELPFERCLTLGRVKSGILPDLDCDFSSKSKVLEYLKAKYNNNTAPISINSLIKVKAAIRDVERMEKGEVIIETEMMCRALPNIPQGVESLKWLNGYMDKETETWVQGFLEDPSDAAKKLKEYSQNEPVIWQTVTKCLGIMRQKSQHACASIITDQEVSSIVPLTMIGDELITGFCPKSCEYVGLVKFDFLGVQTLESIRLSLAEIKKDTGEDFPWGEFPAEPKDYENIIRPMQTAGLFQIKTHTMRPFVQNTQPRSTGDLSNLVALVRPGAMDAPAPDGSDMSAAEYFVAVRQGRAKPYYIHSDLAPILSESYGVVLFQEQTLRVFRDLAGYSYETAEGVRRAIGKKVKEEMELHLGVLKTKLLEREWSSNQINALVESILASARYSFNKSHSTSCGIVTNNGIFLKSRYPLYFYLGELQSNIDDRDKAREIMSECRSFILPPDILTSHPTEWRIEQAEKLRAPLSIVKGVGGKAASSISLIMQNGITGLALKPAPVKKEKAPPKPTKKSLKVKELSLD